MSLNIIKRITFVIILLLIIVLMINLKSIITLVFFSMVIAYILNPFVRYLNMKGLNKRLSALLSIFFVLAVFVFFVFIVIPDMMGDLVGAISSLEKYTDKITYYINSSGYHQMPKYIKDILENNILKLENMSIKYLNQMFKQLIDLGAELPTYILAPVFIYYFLIDTVFFTNIIQMLIPEKIRARSVELGRDMDKIIGGFLRSQIILSFIVMIMTFVVLIFFKVKYAIVIAFLNGIANIIPYFGPIIGLVPAFLAALAESGNKAILICIILIIVQEIESSIIAPKLVGDSIGIHPVFVAIVLLVGGKYFGAWGLIFSIPVGGMIKVTWNYIVRSMY